MIILNKYVAFVYMLLVDRLRKPHKGRLHLFYTGYTSDIIERYYQHMCKEQSNFLRINHPGSRKKLVYVEVVKYTPEKYRRGGMHPREARIKRMSHDEKAALMESHSNQLHYLKVNFAKPVVILKNGIIMAWNPNTTLDGLDDEYIIYRYRARHGKHFLAIPKDRATEISNEMWDIVKPSGYK